MRSNSSKSSSDAGFRPIGDFLPWVVAQILQAHRDSEFEQGRIASQAMLEYFALPTATGAAVCYDSPSLGGAMAVIDCATLHQAQHEAVRRNLESAQRLAKLAQQSHAKFELRPARLFGSEAA